MKARLIFVLSGIFALLVLLSGCAQEQAVVAKGTTPTQKAFYDVQSLYEKGKYEQALAAGEAFLSEYPTHLFAEAVHYYTGSSAQKLGRADEAKSHFEKIVQDNPKGNWAQLAKFNLEELGVKVSEVTVTKEDVNPDMTEQTTTVFEDATQPKPAEETADISQAPETAPKATGGAEVASTEEATKPENPTAE